MAYLRYTIGYRQGSDDLYANTSVVTYYLADTYAELPVAVAGDLGFAKDVQALFQYKVGAWRYAYDGGGIYGDIVIYKAQPRLILQDPGVAGVVGRVFSAFGNRVDLSKNLNHNGSGFVKDDLSKGAGLLTLDENGTYIYTMAPGSNTFDLNLTINKEGNIIHRNATYEFNRSTPQGVWTQVPYSSSNFYVDVGTITTDTNSLIRYCLIGKTCFMNISIYNATLSAATTLVKVRLPAGVVAMFGYEIGSGTVFSGTWQPGSANIQPDHVQLGIQWPGTINLAAGTFMALYQLQFAIN